jgi:hypothetical protein
MVAQHTITIGIEAAEDLGSHNVVLIVLIEVIELVERFGAYFPRGNN